MSTPPKSQRTVPSTAVALNAATLRLERRDGGATLVAGGDWVVRQSVGLDRDLAALKLPAGGALAIDLSGVGKFDTAGAWLLERTRDAVLEGGGTVTIARRRNATGS